MEFREPPSHSLRTKVDPPEVRGDDELSLYDLFVFLAREKVLIFSVVLLFTLASLSYVFLAERVYRVNIFLLPPDESFVPSSFGEDFLQLEKEDIFNRFLIRVNSYFHQLKIFNDGKYSEKFSGAGGDEDNRILFDKVNESINIVGPDNIKGPAVDDFFIISAEGDDPEVLSGFLNEITNAGITETKNALLEQIERKRKAMIANIESRIRLLRSKEKEKRIIEAHTLSQALVIAKKLGIKDNNMSRLGNASSLFPNNMTFLIEREGDSKSKMARKRDPFVHSSRSMDMVLPTWYLYGSDALTEKLKFLQKSDIPESEIKGVGTLRAQLDELNTMDFSLIRINVAKIIRPSLPRGELTHPPIYKILFLGPLLGFVVGVVGATLRSFGRGHS